MKQKVGFPDDLLDDTSLNQRYEGVRKISEFKQFSTFFSKEIHVVM